MKCNVSQLELTLTKDHCVVIKLRCKTAYEAAVVYADIHETAQDGSLILEFDIKNLSPARFT